MMFGFSVNVDYQEVLDLARSISSSLKSILENNNEMKQNLRNLGVTFQDEGFEKVCGMVANSEKNLREATPDLLLVSTKLLEYADDLFQSTKKL